MERPISDEIDSRTSRTVPMWSSAASAQMTATTVMLYSIMQYRWNRQVTASALKPWPGPFATCSRSAGCLPSRHTSSANAKRVYYLSMEFLIGRTLIHNIMNMGVEQLVREDLRSDPRQDWTEVIDTEPDAGLGNGGLGRLAACFMDSLATLAIPAMGYGLRYDYGIFRQEIKNGNQVEYPDHWLKLPGPLGSGAIRGKQCKVPLACSFRLENGTLRAVPDMHSHLLGVPYDRPVVGYGGGNINTLRLWSATSPDFFDFGEFSSGDFVGAIVDRMAAETVTRVLYPDDSTVAGQALRFVQEYFLVCCSLADIVARFRRTNNDWRCLARKGCHSDE